MNDDENGQLGNLYCVYGYPEEQNKKKTWQLVQALFKDEGDKVIVLGDLNDILWENEKK